MPGHRRKGWTDEARARAAHRNRVAQSDHDAQCVGIIRNMRAMGESWRCIAGYLDMCVDPPGRRGEWTPGAWSHKAVQRIAARHGVQ